MKAKEMVAIRRKLKLSQEKMARLLGVSYVSVNRWENQHSTSVIGAVSDLYDALAEALRRGYRPERILTSSSDKRGRFLLDLFTLAYANKGDSIADKELAALIRG